MKDDSKAVAVQSPPINAVAEVANGPEGIPAIQGQLAEWARIKLTEARQEEQELRAAHAEAKVRKWKCSTLLTAANKALLRVTYYEKVVAALDAGYMLFPPIDNIDVIAIRTTAGVHDQDEVRANYVPSGYRSYSEHPPVGTGEYKDPRIKFKRWGKVKVTKQNYKGESYTEDVNNWRPLYDLTSPEFPLVMAKMSCINATSAAMEGKFFDEIAIYPARARKDPVILGRIWDPSGRWRNFLISWRVNRADL